MCFDHCKKTLEIQTTTKILEDLLDSKPSKLTYILDILGFNLSLILVIIQHFLYRNIPHRVVTRKIDFEKYNSES